MRRNRRGTAVESDDETPVSEKKIVVIRVCLDCGEISRYLYQISKNEKKRKKKDYKIIIRQREKKRTYSSGIFAYIISLTSFIDDALLGVIEIIIYTIK